MVGGSELLRCKRFFESDLVGSKFAAEVYGSDLSHPGYGGRCADPFGRRLLDNVECETVEDEFVDALDTFGYKRTGYCSPESWVQRKVCGCGELVFHGTNCGD